MRLAAHLALLLLVHAAGPTHAEEALWKRLQGGGLVILMKHAAVPDDGPGIPDLFTRDPSCRTERNLTRAGRAQARQTGRHFAEHGIPVERVMHSNFCRTRDTAVLAFGEASPSKFLTVPALLPQRDQEAYRTKLTRLISYYEGKGNLVLVTHSPVISAISFTLVEKDTALVVEPLGDGEFEELGKIRLF